MYNIASYIMSHMKVIIVFLLIFLWLGYITFYNNGFIGDEGLVLENAQRILDGQIPHVDFYSWVTPGIFYLLALIWKIFGINYLVVKILAYIIVIFGTIGLYLNCRRLVDRGYSLIGVAIFSIALYPFQNILSYHWIAMAFIQWATYFYFRNISNPNRRNILCNSIFTSLAIIIHHIMGAVFFFILLLHMTFMTIKKKKFDKWYIFAYLGITLVPVSGVLSYIIARAGFGAVWHDLIEKNMSQYVNYNYIPVHNNMLFYFYWLSLLATIASIYYFRKRINIYIGFYFTISVVFSVIITYRFDCNHISYIYPTFMLPMLLYAFCVYPKSKKLLLKLGKVLYITILSVPVIICLLAYLIFFSILPKDWPVYESVIGNVHMQPSLHYELSHIKKALTDIPEENILIHPATYLYTFLGKKNPTYYNTILKGFLSDKEVNDLKRQIIEKDIKYVLWSMRQFESSITEEWMDSNFPNKIVIINEDNLKTNIYYK